MKNFLKGIVVAMFAALSMTTVAAERGSADEAVAMVKRAVALVNASGKEKAFAEISNPKNPEFHDRDLYIYVYDMNGNCVAHGNNPRMEGKNLLDLRDPDGKYIVKNFIDAVNTKGKGWVDFKWPNPVTKAVEQKAGYVEKVGDLIVGSGIYKK